MDDIADLAALLERMAAAPVDRTNPDLAGRAVELCGLLSRFEGVVLTVLEAVDRGGAAAADGAVSTGSWLHSRTDMTFANARRRLRTARILADVLPRACAELRSGTLSVDKVHVLARAVELTDVTREAAAAKEAALLDIVRPVPMHTLPRVLADWQHAVDPEGADRGEDNRHHSRWVTASPTIYGMVAINGLLDAAGGAAVLNALEAGSGWRGVDDSRNKKVRRADALVDLARAALDSGSLPDVAGERPHVTITVDVHTLTGADGPPAVLDGVGPISPELARQLACDAGISRIITAGKSEILDVGRKTRTIGSALRRALNLRDRQCVFDGCDRPKEWCEGHHLIHWADGGPTNLENLALLCSFHHHLIHQDGWTLHREHDRWITERPDPNTDPPPRRRRAHRHRRNRNDHPATTARSAATTTPQHRTAGSPAEPVT